MIQIDWSLLLSSIIFLITLFALNRILFRPLIQVLQERKARTSDLFDSVSDGGEYQEALLQQYETKIKEERQAGYRLAERVRIDVLQVRQTQLKEARDEADSLISEAKSAVEADLIQTRKQLRRDAEEIAGLISGRVLKGS